MPVYLLHYDKPLGGRGRASARHYLGYVSGGAADVRRRVEQHNAGQADAKITQAFFVIGATGALVRTWPAGTRADERRLKRAGRYSDWCPVCNTYRYGRGAQRTKGTIA